jgi:hypothetical protein
MGFLRSHCHIVAAPQDMEYSELINWGVQVPKNTPSTQISSCSRKVCVTIDIVNTNACLVSTWEHLTRKYDVPPSVKINCIEILCSFSMNGKVAHLYNQLQPRYAHPPSRERGQHAMKTQKALFQTESVTTQTKIYKKIEADLVYRSRLLEQSH